MIRSTLRRRSSYWKPAAKCLEASKRPFKGSGRQKWEYQCNSCKKWWDRKSVAVDHIIPVGSLKCSDDLKGFVERLFIEEGFQTLCKTCHQNKTNEERVQES